MLRRYARRVPPIEGSPEHPAVVGFFQGWTTVTGNNVKSARLHLSPERLSVDEFWPTQVWDDLPPAARNTPALRKATATRRGSRREVGPRGVRTATVTPSAAGTSP